MLCLGLVFALVMSSFLVAFLNSCTDLQFDRNMDLGLRWIYSNYLLFITFHPDLAVVLLFVDFAHSLLRVGN